MFPRGDHPGEERENTIDRLSRQRPNLVPSCWWSSNEKGKVKASPPMGCGASSEGGGGGSSVGDAAAAAAAAEVVRGEENKVQNFFTFLNSGF